MKSTYEQLIAELDPLFEKYQRDEDSILKDHGWTNDERFEEMIKRENDRIQQPRTIHWYLWKGSQFIIPYYFWCNFWFLVADIKWKMIGLFKKVSTAVKED